MYTEKYLSKLFNIQENRQKRKRNIDTEEFLTEKQKSDEPHSDVDHSKAKRKRKDSEQSDTDRKKKKDKSKKEEIVEEHKISEESDAIETDFNEDEQILTPQEQGLLDMSDCTTIKHFKKRAVALFKALEVRTRRLNVVDKKITAIEEKGLDSKNKKYHTAMRTEKLLLEERIKKLLDGHNVAEEKLKELGYVKNENYKEEQKKRKKERAEAKKVEKLARRQAIAEEKKKKKAERQALKAERQALKAEKQSQKEKEAETAVDKVKEQTKSKKKKKDKAKSNTTDNASTIEQPEVSDDVQQIEITDDAKTEKKSKKQKKNKEETEVKTKTTKQKSVTMEANDELNILSEFKGLGNLEPALEVPSVKDFWSDNAEVLSKTVQEGESSSSDEEVCKAHLYMRIFLYLFCLLATQKVAGSISDFSGQ